MTTITPESLSCPVCGIELPGGKLLAHAWSHLKFETHHNGTRVCWCGKGYQAFVYWMEHMAGKDVQAHYAAALLNIPTTGFRNAGEHNP